MQIKKKTIDKHGWERLEKSKFVVTETTEKPGVAALLFIEKVKEPLKRFCFGREMTLADDGYYWLQLGFTNENTWLTVSFDKNHNFIQYYFDVSLKNEICGEKSYFLDLFIDVIVQERGECAVLDRDELDTALNCGIISPEQHEMAVNEANKIVSTIEQNRDKLDQICKKYFDLLLKKL